MAFSIIKNDITQVAADAVVLPANPLLREGPGVSNAIFEAAGRNELRAACGKIGYCNFGSAVITDGFSLSAKHIIHTVNPPYIDGKHNESKMLKKAYISAMELAAANGLKSIAFPLLSSGNYGYPRGEALNVANKAIKEFLNRDEVYNDMEIILVLKDESAIREELIHNDEIDRYYSSRHAISNNLKGLSSRKRVVEEFSCIQEKPLSCDSAKFDDDELPPSFDPFVATDSFLDVLIKHINASGMTNAQLYTKANISKQSFSKIISGDVVPKKETILALAIALKLNIDETTRLLAKAGHSLVDFDKGDTIVRWFIVHKKYDIFLLNETLFANNQKLLGSSIA